MAHYQLVVRYEADTDNAATILAENALNAFKDEPAAQYAFNKILDEDAQVSGEEPADSE